MDQENLVDSKKSKIQMIRGSQEDQSISWVSKLIFLILFLVIIVLSCLVALLVHQSSHSSEINETNLSNEEIILSREKLKLEEPIESTDAILAKTLQRDHDKLKSEKAQQDILVESLQKTINERGSEISRLNTIIERMEQTQQELKALNPSLQEKEKVRDGEISTLRRQISRSEQEHEEALTTFHLQLDELRSGVERLATQIGGIQDETSQQFAALKGGCDRNWKYFANFCYWFGREETSDGTSDWPKSKCQELNLTLVSIHSQAENDFVRGLSLVSPRLGLTLVRHWWNGDKWEWSDGSKLDYTNWGVGKPDDNIDHKWTYIRMDDGKWHNHGSGYTGFTVCKKPAEI